jgi:type I restriction enzyme R subunit
LHHRGVDPLIDYVLLDEDNSVLAIIEVQVFSQNDEKGRTRPRIYANDIIRQTGIKVPVFLTNWRIWRLVDEDGIEGKISGPFSQEDLKRRADLYSKRRKPLRSQN